MKGTVTFVNEKDFGDKKLHSFRLAGDDKYYNCGTYAPDVRKGELVEFDGEDKGSGKFQVNVRSIKVLKEAGPEVATPVRGQSGGFRKFAKDEKKEAYWDAKALRDVETQKVIQLQSSRNSAIALADVMLKYGILDFEKIKVAKRQETIQNLVNELIDQFQTAAAELNAPKDVKIADEPVAEEDELNDEWS